MSEQKYKLWMSLCTAPHHFVCSQEIWEQSMYHDRDSDGRILFDSLQEKWLEDGFIQYGRTAFGFDDHGEISPDIHYNVIRQLYFTKPETGHALLQAAEKDLGEGKHLYAFFHYFGMSACARHGKLHEKDLHIESLLLDHNFTVEHENVYYSRHLTDADIAKSTIFLLWKAENAGSCREFAAMADGREIGWGQVHFLPQGDIAYLRWIYIDAPFQHRGFGKAIMQALFSDLLKMGIRRFDTDTALDNNIAQAYYEKCGFKNEGITRSYYTK